MKKMKILYHLRYGNPKTYATINCRITIDGVRSTIGQFPLSCKNHENDVLFFKDEIYTSIRIESKKWDLEKERIKSTDTQSSINNEILINFKAKLYHIARSLAQNGLMVTADKIKRVALGMDKLTYTFNEIANMFINEVSAVSEQREKTGKGRWSNGTFLAYFYKIENFKLFLEESRVADIACEMVDKSILEKYKSWNLLKGNGEVYVGKASQCVKTCISWAFDRKYINSNPLYAHPIRITKQNNLTHLEPFELLLLETYSFFSDRQQNVVDCYLFSCYTGLCYADIKNVNKSELMICDNILHLSGNRVKTKTQYFVALQEKAIFLLTKRGGLDGISKIVRSNAEMNRILKDCVDVVGIKKRVWYHTARKTFIHISLNINKTNKSTIILSTGHKDTKELDAYATLSRDFVTEDFKRVQAMK